MAVARGSVSALHPKVPRPRLPQELRALSGAGKWGEAASTRQSGNRGRPGGGGCGPELTPRGPRTRAPRPVGACRRQVADGGRRAQAPGGAAGGGPAARMPLALALGKGPGGRRHSRAPSGKPPPPPPRSGAPAPFYFLYRSERGFQEEAGLGGQGCFFVKSLSAAARCPKPRWGTRKPGGRAPGAGPGGGRCRAEAPGAGVQPPGAASAGWGCGCGCESRDGNSEKRLQLGEESRGEEGAPGSCLPWPQTCRWEAKSSAQGTRGRSHGVASRPEEPPNLPWAVPDQKQMLPSHP